MFVLPQNAVIGCKPSLMNLKCIYKKKQACDGKEDK